MPKKHKTPSLGWDDDAEEFDSTPRIEEEAPDAFADFDYRPDYSSGAPKTEAAYDDFAGFDYSGETGGWDDDWSRPVSSRKKRRRKKNKNQGKIAAAACIVLALGVGWMLMAGNSPKAESGRTARETTAGNQATFPQIAAAVTDPPTTQATAAPETVPTVPAATTPAATTPVQTGANVVYYCRSQLNDQDKALYDRIYTAMINMENVPEIYNASNDHIFMVLNYVWLDHPEVFWVESGILGMVSYYEDGSLPTELSINYTYTAAERDQIQRALDAYAEKALSGLEGLSQYEQVKAVYEYIINNSDYVGEYYAQDLTDILLHGKGVCAGYARMTQYLLQQLGIETLHVRGYGKQERHAWNIVKVEGEYYQLDTTWGDPVRENGEAPSLNYNYFCITSEEMYRDHRVAWELQVEDWNLQLPDCTATSCNYFIREGRFFTSFDRSAVLALLKNDMANQRPLTMKFSNASVLQDFYRQLLEQDVIYDLLKECGYSVNGLRYSKDDEKMILTIYVD